MYLCQKRVQAAGGTRFLFQRLSVNSNLCGLEGMSWNGWSQLCKWLNDEKSSDHPISDANLPGSDNCKVIPFSYHRGNYLEGFFAICWKTQTGWKNLVLPEIRRTWTKPKIDSLIWDTSMSPQNHDEYRFKFGPPKKARFFTIKNL